MENSIAALNIKLGVNLDDLRRDLRVAERTLKNTASGLSAIGRDMTTYISLPLLGIGAATVKAAGEFEALRLSMRATFEGAGRSMSEADAELENLRRSALAPGLDLEQAVKGSIRLQNVGFSAENARVIIEELANAIASTGGTAEDLDEVTRQFTQMIGKGKILQEDLKIIESRMPILSRLMKETWGTATAEGLRDAGVSAAEFVETMTTKMKELPRVAGGVSNSIVNATSAVRQFAVGIGDLLNQNLGLKGMIDGFANWLGKLTERMKELSPETKEFLAGVAKWAVIIPPVIFGIAGLAKAQAALRAATILASTAVLDFGKSIVSLGASFMNLSQTINTRAAFDAFNAKIAATSASMNILRGVVMGGVVVGIVALGVALYDYSQSSSAAERAAMNLADGQKAVQKEAAGEMAIISQAISVLKNDKAAKEERSKAIELLLQKYPEYLKGIDLEKAGISKLDSIQKDLNESILRSIAYRMKANAVNAIYAKQAEKIVRIQQLREGAAATVAESGLINTGDMIRAGSIGAAVILKLEAQIKSLGEEAAETGAQFDRAFKLGDNQTDASGWYAQREKEELSWQSLGKKRAELTKEQIDLEKERQKVELEGSKAFFKDFSLDAEKAKAAKAEELKAAKEILLTEQMLSAEYDIQDEALKGILANQSLMAQPIGAAPIGGGATNVAPSLPDATKPEGLQSWKDSIIQLSEAFTEMGDSAVQAYSAALEAAKEGGITSKEQHEAWKAGLRSLAKAAVQASSQIIGAYIREGVAASVSKTLATVPFPFNIALGAAAGAASEGLFKMLIARISAPKLAKGGLAYGPTMAMVGDNPNARANPEVIAPLSKLKGMLADSGGGGFMVSHRIEGNDLLLLVERAQNKRTRARGF